MESFFLSFHIRPSPKIYFYNIHVGMVDPLPHFDRCSMHLQLVIIMNIIIHENTHLIALFSTNVHSKYRSFPNHKSPLLNLISFNDIGEPQMTLKICVMLPLFSMTLCLIWLNMLYMSTHLPTSVWNSIYCVTLGTHFFLSFSCPFFNFLP